MQKNSLSKKKWKRNSRINLSLRISKTKQKFQMITARYLSKWIHYQLIRIKIKLNPNRKHQLRLTLPHRKKLIKKMWIMLVFLEMEIIRCKKKKRSKMVKLLMCRYLKYKLNPIKVLLNNNTHIIKKNIKSKWWLSRWWLSSRRRFMSRLRINKLDCSNLLEPNQCQLRSHKFHQVCPSLLNQWIIWTFKIFHNSNLLHNNNIISNLKINQLNSLFIVILLTIMKHFNFLKKNLNNKKLQKLTMKIKIMDKKTIMTMGTMDKKLIKIITMINYRIWMRII